MTDVHPAESTPFVSVTKRNPKPQPQMESKLKERIYDGNVSGHVCPPGYSHVKGYCRIIKRKRGRYMTKKRIKSLLELERQSKSKLM